MNCKEVLKKTIAVFIISLTFCGVFAQQGVSINIDKSPPDNSAILDVQATNKGILIPRVALQDVEDKITIPLPATGLVVYNINPEIKGASGTGLFYNKGSKEIPSWERLVANSDIVAMDSTWSFSGNSNINAAINFIGTTNNQDMVFKRNYIEALRITDGGALLAENKADVIVTPVPSSGIGTRLMWIPETHSFRAGRVEGTQWDNNNVGVGSFAIGKNTIASGAYSVATGFQTSALGSSSTALGYSTSATGQYATAMGFQTVASGNYTTAGGNQSRASGLYATAFGYKDSAIGTASTALGAENYAKGNYSAAIGRYDTTNADYAISLGYKNNAAANSSVAIGNSNSAEGISAISIGFNSHAKGNYSSSFGWNNYSDGDYSVTIGAKNTTSIANGLAMGYNNKSTKQYATAIGNSVEANGLSSTAMGYFTSANGDYSTALGIRTIASGLHGTALGYYTNATGEKSTAMGTFTTAAGLQSTTIGYRTNALQLNSFAGGSFANAKGSNSFAFGEGVIASHYGGVAFGRYNDTSTLTDHQIIPTSCIANNDPDFTYKVFQFGAGTSNSQRFDLFTLDSRGNLRISGDLIQLHGYCPSDIRLKEHIEPLQNALEKIKRIQPISYYFKDKAIYSAKHEIGVNAQEIEKEYPELIKKNEKGFLAVNYSQLVAVALQGIKEQQNIIVNQNDQINNLQKQMEEQKQVIEQLNNKNSDMENRLQQLEKIVRSGN